MKNELDVQRILLLYNKIVKYGEKPSHNDSSQRLIPEYKLGGLTAISDFEGYTLEITDGRVTLSLLFHNKYQFDYPDEAALDNFMGRLDEVEKLLINH